ncbi:MAG TPA: hypothetical protein P5279_15835 [Anaerohalosphaeraceae bacterium]|jgi:ABC-type transport system involved in multi-copper enzyme maturation permease subunit|nr:hypothetical protein [Anaerohalosphaeraceae bacterium]HRT51960.1 hypothetical protein [Anaerohalosphaeraceae bacterium]HRT88016.1 hypothetical protein [Anaerohalosphaeraceae bacterium]
MHSVWAVARNTIAQAVRMKVAALVIVLLLVLIPLMSVVLVGDETLHGKLQTFSSYSLSLMTMLLCILTIAVSTWTLSNDLRRKHLFLIVTKPITRWQIVLGKLCGILILDAVLLVLFSTIIYVLTLAIPYLDDAPPEEVKKAADEFFTARAGRTVEEDEEEIERRAWEAYQKLRDTDQIPPDMTQQRVLSELRSHQRMLAKAVPVNTRKIWEFNNVRVRDPNETLFVRFKYDVAVTPIDDKVHGVWAVGDTRQLELAAGGWKTPLAQVVRSDVTRTMTEIEVPASVVAEDGFVGVIFFNSSMNDTTVFLENVELLYREGTFTGNFIKVVLLIALRLVFLAALGVFASTWLSFPVAFLLAVTIFMPAMIRGFIAESFESIGNIGIILKQILWLLPQFDGEANPTHYMVMGRLLRWGTLVVTGLVVLIKAGALTAFGMWIFGSREIAKTAV